MTENLNNIILNELKPIIDEYNFEFSDGVYKNENFAFSFSHDEEAKVLRLMCGTVTDGKAGELSEASAFLFDDPENERDAMSAGMDFADTLKTRFGIKRTNNYGANVLIPKADKTKAPDVDSFTGTVLSVYPELKEVYKSEVESHNGFLALNFHKTYTAKKVRDVVLSGNQKQIKKIFSTLSTAYEQGDKMVGDIVVGIILTGAANFDSSIAEKITEGLGEYTYLKNAFTNYFALSLKDKKVKEMLS